jgi:hypothetical protein
MRGQNSFHSVKEVIYLFTTGLCLKTYSTNNDVSASSTHFAVNRFNAAAQERN